MGLSELRVCLVGFGSIARTHASALAALPAVRPTPFRPLVWAIATDRPGEVAAEAAALGISRVGSLAEMLDDPTLDAFDVTSRNARHLEHAGAVLRAGRALYVEKPVGRTPEEAKTLAALASASPRVSQVGFMMRYLPAVIETRALLRAGAIGEVRQARFAIFHGSYLDPDRATSWKLQAAQAGAGAMLDLGLHLIDLVTFLLGEPRVTAARHATFVPERPDGSGGRRRVDVEDWAWAELSLPQGGQVTVEVSRIALGVESSPMQIFGTQGSLIADLASAEELRFRRIDGDEAPWRARLSTDPEVRILRGLLPPARLTLGPFVDSHLGALHHFLLRVAADDPAPGIAPSVAESAAAERLVATIVRSQD